MNARRTLDLLMEDPDHVVRGGETYGYSEVPQLAFLIFGEGSALGTTRFGQSHKEMLKGASVFGRIPSMASSVGLYSVGNGFEEAPYADLHHDRNLVPGRIFPKPNVIAFWTPRSDVQFLMPTVVEIVKKLGHDATQMDYEFGDTRMGRDRDNNKSTLFMTYAEVMGGPAADTVSDEERERIELLRQAHMNPGARAKLDQRDPGAAQARVQAAGSSVNARRANRAGFPHAAGYNAARRIGDSLQKRPARR